MEKKLLMGNEAIALGAIRAGVRVVTGYPGTPSSEILETVAKNNSGEIYVEWSVNEKSALEVAAGASYAGARTMVTMKQVGLNVASDPLMSLNYVGVKGGMVVVVADDPGPISSQTEQDTRHFGMFAKVAVFDPTTPEEAFFMVADAFDISEKYGAPVLLRPTTRVCHSCAALAVNDIREKLPVKPIEGFIKDSKWVIFPRLSYESHKRIEENIRHLSAEFSYYPYNILSGKGKRGIAAGGVSYAYVSEALEDISTDYQLLKVSTVPFPYDLGRRFLDGLDEVLVVEELDPVIERELIYLCGLHGISVRIMGKLSGHIANAGENTVDSVTKAVRLFLMGEKTKAVKDAREVSLPPLPVRPPVLCAGCPHRASFYSVKEAAKGRRAIFSGDIGCYTLGNAKPLDMVDTCLCMGAGITVAQGLHRAQPDMLNFAFIGDSTFFHTGIPGIVNAVYNRTDIIIIILDNGTTAMTGNQPHPGTGLTMMGSISDRISIYNIVSALGISHIAKVNPFELGTAVQAVKQAMDQKGVRVIIFEAPCIAIASANKAFVPDASCTGCKLCIKKLGCPALVSDGDRIRIDEDICTGCRICAQICPSGALHAKEREE